LGRCDAAPALVPPRAGAAGRCSARCGPRASAAHRRSAGGPSVGSLAPGAGRVRERDAQPVADRQSAAAASICGAPARGANAAASAASRSAPNGVAVEGAGSERQGRRDQSLEHTAAAAADEAPRADAAEPTVRRPWRTRCGGPARATAAASRRRDTQRKGASADAPRARRHRHPGAEPSFETPQATISHHTLVVCSRNRQRPAMVGGGRRFESVRGLAVLPSLGELLVVALGDEVLGKRPRGVHGVDVARVCPAVAVEQLRVRHSNHGRAERLTSARTNGQRSLVLLAHLPAISCSRPRTRSGASLYSCSTLPNSRSTRRRVDGHTERLLLAWTV
jgi:hypothetical protein